MTKFILSMLLFFGLAVNAQQKKISPSQLKAPPTPPGLYAKITFSYDGEGNQTQRNYCYSCSSKTAGVVPKEIAAIKEEDLQNFSQNDVITYYPNPVKEELYLEWELINDNAVASINVYGLNGQLLKSYSGLTKTNSQNIPFQNYPSGVYTVVLFYRNSEQKTIKIIKQ